MNVKLAKQVLEHIQDLPEGDTWEQSIWIIKSNCGTTACFAGWTCVLSGTYSHGFFAGEKAQELLELSSCEAKYLFFSGHSLDDLKRVILEIEQKKFTDAELFSIVERLEQERIDAL